MTNLAQLRQTLFTEATHYVGHISGRNTMVRKYETCPECSKRVNLNRHNHVTRVYPFCNEYDTYHMSCHDKVTRFSEFIVKD